MDFKYPYTDFHELNLDWFLAEFKKLTAEWLQVQHDWEDEQQAFQDLHDYVQDYFANLNLYQEVHDILYSPEMQQNIQLMLSNLTTSLLPAVVANQIASVVASQIAPVVAAQLPNLLNSMLPSFLPDAVAGEAAAWLADHVDPDTGYVIDDTLNIALAAADAKTVGDKFKTDRTLLGHLNDILDTCYVSESDFNYLLEEYYQNNGTTALAPAGSNYHVAPPVSLEAGTYSLIKIIPSMSYYKVGSTFTQIGSAAGLTDMSLTLSTDAVVYLTTRSANASLVKGIIKSDYTPESLTTGIFDINIDKIHFRDIAKTAMLHKCYANTGSFDFGQDQYYNADGSIVAAAPGSNYHVAPAVVMEAGTVSFCGIIPSFSYYKYEGDQYGTAIGASASITAGTTITLTKRAHVYLTTRTADTQRVIFAVDGDYIPDNIPAVGLFDAQIPSTSLYKLGRQMETAEYYEETDDTSLSMYEKVAVIGDSYSSGGLYGIPGIQTQGRHLSIAWLAVLGRRCGFTSRIYGVSGGNTYTFLNDNVSEYGLRAMLDDPPHNLYFIMLGINGDEDDNIGTIADCNVDWTQNAESFYGRYGKIIGNIMNHAPKAKIVCIVPPQGVQRFQAIVDVAAFYQVPSMATLDDRFFHSDFYLNTQFTSHPIGVTYAGMANAINRLYTQCVIDNVAYFQDYEG